MCAGEHSSNKGCVLKTSMKYKLKEKHNIIKAACGLNRNRPEKLNCPGPFLFYLGSDTQ